MQHVRQFLERRQLTQEEFAGKVGVTQGVVSLWLSGKKRPSLDNLLTLSSVTEIPIETLISDLQKQVA